MRKKLIGKKASDEENKEKFKALMAFYIESFLTLHYTHSTLHF